MKTYVLMISKVFPATHPRKGEETHFMSKILLPFDRCVVRDEDDNRIPSVPGYGSKYAAAIIRENFDPKRHTIRPNHDLWAKRAEKINRGEAVLSLREWSGLPYRSKQIEFLQLKKIGVQRVRVNIYEVHVKPLPAMDIKGGSGLMMGQIIVDGKEIQHYRAFYSNDGFSGETAVEDFKSWVGVDVGTDKALIHFTENFRY